MLHVTRLTTGLQDLLCEGRFVDVRICCSDHSPSDGLGAHRAMLAAASPGLLGPSLQGEESEEEMVCLQLPDYTRYEVNNIHLSRLGESAVKCTYSLITVSSILQHLEGSIVMLLPLRRDILSYISLHSSWNYLKNNSDVSE